MRNLNKALAVASFMAIGCALPAHAAVLNFSGSVTGQGIVGPDASCAPRARGNINPASTTGSSTLGAFTYSHSVCTSGPPGGPLDGTYAIDFGNADTFFGTLAGTSAANPTMPGIFDFNLAWTVLGGTGRFLGATGGFVSGPGSNANINFQPSVVTFNFQDGLINAPAIPEPGTWALLIIGFGTIGSALRRRRPARVGFA